MAMKITKASTSDIKAAYNLTNGIKGKLFADKGYKNYLPL